MLNPELSWEAAATPTKEAAVLRLLVQGSTPNHRTKFVESEPVHGSGVRIICRARWVWPRRAVHVTTELRRGQAPKDAVRISDQAAPAVDRPRDRRGLFPQEHRQEQSICRHHHDAVRLWQDGVPPPRAGGWPQLRLRPGTLKPAGESCAAATSEVAGGMGAQQTPELDCLVDARLKKQWV